MTNHQRILAVDDNALNLAILEEILADRFEMQCVQSATEALRVAVTWNPTVVLLDVMMPDLDGLELCRYMRQICALRKTIIVFVTAKALASERSAGLAAGGDDYLVKPFEEVQLLDVLRRHQVMAC